MAIKTLEIDIYHQIVNTIEARSFNKREDNKEIK